MTDCPRHDHRRMASPREGAIVEMPDGTFARLVPVTFRSELDPLPGVQLYRIEAP